MWRRPAGKGPSCARPRAPGLCLYGVVAQIRRFHTYHNESSWATIAGRLAVSVGIWFGLQALFSALVEVHILVRLFALPATLAGGEGYVLGALVFLIGGLVLWIAGSRLGLKRPSLPSKAAFVVSTAAFLGLAVPGLALLIVFTNVGRTTLPAGGPGTPSADEALGYTSDVYNLPEGAGGGTASQSVLRLPQELKRQLTVLWYELPWGISSRRAGMSQSRDCSQPL